MDGGLDIPHSEKRFVGYDKDGKSLDAEQLHKFIYGGHVADYMNEMQAREDLHSFSIVLSARGMLLSVSV